MTKVTHCFLLQKPKLKLSIKKGKKVFKIKRIEFKYLVLKLTKIYFSIPKRYSTDLSKMKGSKLAKESDFAILPISPIK